MTVRCPWCTLAFDKMLNYLLGHWLHPLIHGSEWNWLFQSSLHLHRGKSPNYKGDKLRCLVWSTRDRFYSGRLQALLAWSNSMFKTYTSWDSLILSSWADDSYCLFTSTGWPYTDSFPIDAFSDISNGAYKYRLQAERLTIARFSILVGSAKFLLLKFHLPLRGKESYQVNWMLINLGLG